MLIIPWRGLDMWRGYEGVTKSDGSKRFSPPLLFVGLYLP
jgi:hypothetical protein